ncbi:E3 ubiquitin-protein ligase TRIM39-like [Heteronotia binoei]|uniref:E3 ubiquitin-protein ligase TRIM39-like n=1 Tax=Heteronotia binoei TaxID=13085 RepID=UPI00292D0342|nr:E3 ubiquitin-protein ligase TRIM39-like [Heteronotia binoei]XP_060094592.1 E3 ubiquitin-protein ligase TRIM39-like [Heteronotia binoei]
MASASPSTEIEQEAKCPICLECLTDPVVLDCGHSFCRACITDYCEKWETLGDLECPVCKFKFQKGAFRRNWQLANLVEKIKLVPRSSRKGLCLRHQEKLHFFCKEDEKLVCAVCERLPEHKGHTILPLEVAAQEYKDQFCNPLEILKKGRERIVAYKGDVEKESQDLLKQTKEQKQETEAKFMKLHTILEKQKNFLLAQMDEVEKEVVRNRDRHLARISEELSSLESLIRKMEEKCQQPASDLLQDVRSTLQRYEDKESFENPVAIPLALKRHIWDFSDLNLLLEGIKKQLKANVTLDPDTAHPWLILSEGQKSVQMGETAQTLPTSPKRFENYNAVLGCEGFTGGRHFWEILVGSEENWAVGVARKSVRRKGELTFTPEEGMWAVGKWAGMHRVGIKAYPPLTVSGELKRIRVCLNYAGGRVAFFDADRAALLYEFSGASFHGETLLPFFRVYKKGRLKISS